ncbi:hypothetical protein KY342_00025 [Candidatus Woesearchaeota archaeon]|nr:hypothetical protein [Candidatus Woesearchaeota archaeon]
MKMINLTGRDLVDVLFQDMEFRRKVVPKEPEQAKFKVEEKLRREVHPARLKKVDEKTFETYLYDALANSSVDHMDVVRALEGQGYLWMAANYATVQNVKGADDIKIAALKAVLIPGSASYSYGNTVRIGYNESQVDVRQAVHDLKKQFGLENRFDEIVENAFRETVQEDVDVSVLAHIVSFGVSPEVVEREGLELLARKQHDYRAAKIVSELNLPVDKALEVLRPEYEKWLSIYEDEIALQKRKGEDTRYVRKPAIVDTYEKVKNK